MKTNETRNGFTIVELLVVIAIIGILLGMLMPVIRTVREPARRTHCLNNLRQIALASLNYESTHMKFPLATGLDVADAAHNADQYSGFVALLPFMEQNDLHAAITEGTTIEGVDYAPYPALYGERFPLWKNELQIVHCPLIGTKDTDTAPTHYGFCIGDRARNIGNPESIRGTFANSRPLAFDDLTDGSSNTILFGEIGTTIEDGNECPYAINQPQQLLEDPTACYELVDGKPQQNWAFKRRVPLSQIGRGGHWADGRAGVALFNTILPPKSPSAAVRGSVGVDGIYSASGPHPSTVSIAFGDGSVHSIGTDIDSGDPSHPTPTVEEMADGAPTPYGVWGALGTSSLSDIATDF